MSLCTFKYRYAEFTRLSLTFFDALSYFQFDRTPLDIAIGNGRADLVQILQLAQVLSTLEILVVPMVTDLRDSLCFKLLLTGHYKNIFNTNESNIIIRTLKLLFIEILMYKDMRKIYYTYFQVPLG